MRLLEKRFKRASASRESSGYALVAVITISWAALAFLFASASVLQSIAESARLSRIHDALSNAAERGVEVVVEELNRGCWTGSPTIFELADNVYSSVPVELSPWDGLDSSITVKARVRKVNDSDRTFIRTFSVLHSPQLEPLLSVTTSYDSPPQSIVKHDYWRMVEVSASKNGTSFVRSARSVLQPQLFPPTGIERLPNITDKGIFPSAGMFGNSSITFKPHQALSIQNFNSSQKFSGPNGDGSANYGLDIQSNREISVMGSSNDTGNMTTRIEGNIKVSNNVDGAPQRIASIGDGAQVSGRALSRSGSSSYLPASPDVGIPLPTDAVLANADIAQSGQPDAMRQGLNLSNPVDTSASEESIPQYKSPPVYTEPSAIDLSSVVGQNDEAIEGNSFRIPALTNDTLTRKVSFVPGQTGEGTKIFIDGTEGAAEVVDGSVSPAIDISSSYLQNNYPLSSDPSKVNPLGLQIYYSGSRDVVITLENGADFSGLIWAPNAKVTIQGSGNFNGALVGDNVLIQPGSNVSLNLISNLDDVSADSVGNRSSTPIPAYSFDTTTGDIAVFGYKAVTLQTLKDRLVP